ncbi:GDP-mannose mannosyl hydrolase, partial [Pseudomonas syringae]
LDQHSEYLWLSPAALLARPDVHENTKAYFR